MKKKNGLFLFMIATLILSGCWSSNEINDLAILNILGIDENEAGEIEVSAVFVKPESLFTESIVGGRGGVRENKFLIQTTTGKDMFEALGKISNAVSEKIYFGHVNAVIFGEIAAHKRMESSMDFLRREYDFRPNINILVTKGKAADIIKTPPTFNSTIGMEINDMVDESQLMNTNMIKDLSQFMKDVSSNTKDPITGVLLKSTDIGIESEGENKASQDGQEQQTIETLSLQGTAAFKGGNLKGFLDERQTRGLMAIKGKLRNEIIVLDCAGDDSGTISLIIKESQSQLEPKINDDSIKMDVAIQVEGQIREITCSNFHLDTNQLELLNKQLKEVIKKEALSVLNKAQKQWETDIFGFGEAIYRKEPKLWDQLAPNWRDGYLKDISVAIKVETNISRYGLQTEPSKANESR